MRNLFFPALFVFLISCQKEVTFKMPDAAKKIVVEGRIDVGEPPYVILTRNSNYFGTFDITQQNIFINGATVMVSDGIDTVTLTELVFDSAGVQISVYTDPLFFIDSSLAFTGKPERSYQLWISVDNETISAVTTIPTSYPLDSAWLVYGLKPERPDLVRLFVRYSDPPQLGQYVRYFTRVNSEPFKPGLNSVFEDQIINGTTFEFPIDRGQYQYESFDFEEFGYFKIGDTIALKWSNIDRAHFDFWRTLEYEINQGGPYASPVIVESNIKGGLGVWGGYNSSYKYLIAQ